MIIAVGTIVSSLLCERLTRKLGTGMVTVCSVALTAAALFGFSIAHSFSMLCLLAIPYGLGAGSVDASLNNYVALHYKSRHMSWLHCMWGIGATLGPYVMGYVLTGRGVWNDGYRLIGLMQLILTLVLLLALPLWKKPDSPQTHVFVPVSQPSSKTTSQPTSKAALETTSENMKDKLSETVSISISETASEAETASIPRALSENLRVSHQNASQSAAVQSTRPLKLREILHIPGAKEVMLCFFCYCTVEQTANLWASSYLTLHRGVAPETAARFASLFFIGITVGRALCGFLTFKLHDAQMVRLGQAVIALGIIALLLPGPRILSLAGLIVIGLGCAPIYPSLIHSTPAHFGAAQSQAVIGVQMASAYAGTCLMPSLFGLIANHITVSLLPFYLLFALIVMVWMHLRLLKKAPVSTVTKLE